MGISKKKLNRRGHRTLFLMKAFRFPKSAGEVSALLCDEDVPIVPLSAVRKVLDPDYVSAPAPFLH